MRYRRSRLRRVLKWVATIVCVLLIYLFFDSGLWSMAWASPGVRYEVGVQRASVYVGWRPGNWRRQDDPHCGPPGWRIGRLSTPSRMSRRDWWIHAGALPTWVWIGVPLWCIIVPIAIPTSLAWRRDLRIALVRRRRMKGLCVACGYNLTGNTSGRCPECGATSGSSSAGGQIAPP
jgi:hypothetical protein